MKEYRVIINDESKKLVKDINSFLNEGWELAGGISVTLNPSNSKIIFCQAIVKLQRQVL